MQKCNIKTVVFGKKLKKDGKFAINDAVYVNGVLYIDPLSYWYKKHIFKHLYMLYTANQPYDTPRADLAETFAMLLFNSYDAYVKAKHDPGLYKKIKEITDMQILRSHAYKNMNLNRIIQPE